MNNRAKFMALIGDSRRIPGAMPLVGLVTAVAWSAPTMADTAMQTYDLDLKRCSAEMPLPDGTTARRHDGTTECDLMPYYVACLNEYLVGEYHVSGKHQEFETSSGTAHVRDNWKIISMFFGVTTDRAWYAVGVSPARANFGKVTTFSASGTLTYKPLAEGPTWQEQFVFIQDAQDEEKVKMDKGVYKCLGAN